MQKFMILGAALALGTVTVLPATQAFNFGGEAHAARDGDRQRAGNRAGRGNGERRRAGNREGTRNAARQPRREVIDTSSPRRETRSNGWRGQDRTARRGFRSGRRAFRRDRFDGPRFGRGFHANRSCMRPRRIKRRLHRQGWDVVGFHRAGRRFDVRARSRRGRLHALSVHACNGRIISAHSLERKRHRGAKRAFRKIGRTFKKIF